MDRWYVNRWYIVVYRTFAAGRPATLGSGAFIKYANRSAICSSVKAGGAKLSMISRKRYDWIDQGLQEFTLALRPHVGDWREADVVARARTLNMPELLITTHSHAGKLSPQGSLLELNGSDLELTALKAAENGDGVIVRVADRYGRGGNSELRWHGHAFAISTKP